LNKQVLCINVDGNITIYNGVKCYCF
jgi:hypothetical protein